MELLKEIGIIDYNTLDSPLIPNYKYNTDMDIECMNETRYRCLVGKLISQFMQNPRKGHWDVMCSNTSKDQ